MSICGTLCGADDWNSIALFAQTREGWFRQHLTLPGGIPSHDTINRMFSLLDPKAFRTLFIAWVQDVMVGSGLSGTVAIGGKTVKGSTWEKSKDAIHMVIAWSTDLGMAVGQYKVDGKSNEITAIPKLLALLELQGCLVTLDAMRWQKRIADTIFKRGTDYLLAIKANQNSLHKEVTEYFDRYWENTPEDAPGPVFAERAEHQHGLQEHRRCWVLSESSALVTAKRWQAKTVAARQITLNLLKWDATHKVGVKSKRIACGYSLVIKKEFLKMKISIAMATYNGAKYIKSQLNSFIDQTRQPDELVISDDCSSDETKAIVRDFAKIATFEVKFYCNDNNLGYCGNFNAALLKTTGDLVLLCDQDDVWFPEKIATIERLATENPEALVLMNDALITDGYLNETDLTKLGQIRSAGFEDKLFVMGCCCAVRRELLRLCLPIPEGYKSHDTWIVSFAEGIGKKYISSRVLQYYRRHENNESKFIANSTKRVTRKTVFLKKINPFFKVNKKSQLDDQYRQLEILCSGVERALKLNNEIGYEIALEKYMKETRLELGVQYERFIIRRSPFIHRLVELLRFVRKGGYRGRSGCKDFIKDLLA